MIDLRAKGAALIAVIVLALPATAAAYQPDAEWSASLYVTDATSKVVPSSLNAGTGGMGVDSYSPGRPREFGIEFRRDF